MNAISQSAGDPVVISGMVDTGTGRPSVSPPWRAARDGRITLAATIDVFIA